MSTVKILAINPGSDGDGRKWPKHTYIRNDDHYRERVATNFWIKDLPGGPDPNVTYMLNKLPNGYGGFEKLRPDGERIDYYLYGHPNGRFDSVKKFYPHFKNLMDYGDSQGCSCDLCTAESAKKKVTGGIAMGSRNESEPSASPPRRSRYFTGSNEPPTAAPDLISPLMAKPRGRPPKHGPALTPAERRRVDAEGTPDIYETLIANLKDAEAGQIVDMPIEERMSPDWRSGMKISKDLFKESQSMAHYVPRIGEIVLFVRRVEAEEDQGSNESFHQLNWEAGVVTQMPKEPISEEDLVSDSGKEQGVNYSGFRVEPISEPGSGSKSYSSQHKYVPLHLIRPFIYWQECLKGLPVKDWHPTIWNALTFMSSFCVVGRYKFKGVWPNATVFCQGLYIGSELIMVGDLVRLLPRPREQAGDIATDVLEVTAIRLRFVNLDLEDDEMWSDSDIPYQTSLHISGRVYTLDPSRSFDGVGKSPIDPKSSAAIARLSKYGPWYHYSDPSKTTARIEVPFMRILSRYCDLGDFGARSTPSKVDNMKERQVEMSRGLKGLVDSRQYSRTHDKRIKSNEGQAWFWADTRIEQLDLHEVNGRYVGVKRERTQQELRQWRTALKALDGKQGALQELQAAKKDVKKIERKNNQLSSSAYGMVAASRHLGTESPVTTDVENLRVDDNEESESEAGDEGQADEHDDDENENHGEDDNEEFHDAMQIDEAPSADLRSSEKEAVNVRSTQQLPRAKPQVISLIDSDDEDDRTTNQLAEELAKKIRPNDPRQR